MEYNKTKRGLEKAAAIVGIVMGVIYCIGAIYCVCHSIYAYRLVKDWGEYYSIDSAWAAEMQNYWYTTAIVSIIMCLLTLFFGIATLITSIKLVKSPFDENGQLKNRQGLRIWMLVLSIISGDLIVMGLMIAVLCLKDFKQPKAKKTNQYVYAGQPNEQNEYLEFYNKIQEIKRLRSLEIIDAEAYKKAVTKVIKGILEAK